MSIPSGVGNIISEKNVVRHIVEVPFLFSSTLKLKKSTKRDGRKRKITKRDNRVIYASHACAESTIFSRSITRKNTMYTITYFVHIVQIILFKVTNQSTVTYGGNKLVNSTSTTRPAIGVNVSSPFYTYINKAKVLQKMY